MRLFKQWFGGRAAAREERPTQAGPEVDPGFGAFLLFDTEPLIHAATLLEGMKHLDLPYERVEIADALAADGAHHALVTLDHHQLRLFGFNEPAPDGSIERAIACSHWSEALKQPLRAHAAHLVCQYVGGDRRPSEQQIALLSLAGGLIPSGMVGIVDPAVWNCLPAEALAASLEPEVLEEFRHHVPLGLWTGFMRMYKSDDEVWFCSKGLYRWGVSDLACLGRPEEGDEIFALFCELFELARSTRPRWAPGQTLLLAGPTCLRFEALTEYAEYLDSPQGTLVVVRLDPSEVPEAGEVLDGAVAGELGFARAH